jgi:hypothetical protein
MFYSGAASVALSPFRLRAGNKIRKNTGATNEGRKVYHVQEQDHKTVPA